MVAELSNRRAAFTLGLATHSSYIYFTSAEWVVNPTKPELQSSHTQQNVELCDAWSYFHTSKQISTRQSTHLKNNYY